MRQPGDWKAVVWSRKERGNRATLGYSKALKRAAIAVELNSSILSGRVAGTERFTQHVELFVKRLLVERDRDGATSKLALVIQNIDSVGLLQGLQHLDNGLLFE
nr:hypothetical protein [Tanacetum cinerariifolium]